MNNNKRRICFQWSIYLVNLIDNDNHIQKGTRPCICVSNDINNTWSQNVHFIPLTTQLNGKSEFGPEQDFNFLRNV